jgi:hypothetical protein
MVFILLSSWCHCPSEEMEPVNTTVAPAESRGLAPTFLASVGCLPRSRLEGLLQPHHADKGCPTPGLRLGRWRLETMAHALQGPARLAVPRGAQAPVAHWPTARHAVPGRWPRLPEARVGRVRSGVESVCTAAPALTHCSPGGGWAALPVALDDAGCLWRDAGRPRRLRCGRGAPGPGRWW